MANCLLGFNNRIEAATLTGGSWVAGLPRENMADPLIGLVARTTDDALASTKFLIDLGVDKTSRAIGLANHNISLAGKVRIRASEADPTMVAGVLYDSGWFDAWPAVYTSEDLEWEAPNFWELQYTDEEREGLIYTLIKSADMNMLVRYWLIEIDDTGNSDTYIQIGRVFVGEAWQTSINMDMGASIGFEDPSEIDEAISGAEFYDERAKYRVFQFTISNLPTDEGMSRAFDLMRRSGTTKDVLFQYDPEDTLHALRRSCLGRLRRLSALESNNVDALSTAFEIKEKL